MRAPRIVAAFAIVAGCGSSNYVYRPTAATARADAPTKIEGNQAAAYPVAAGRMRGYVELAVVRTTKLSVSSGRHHRDTHVLVVRMVAHNKGSDIWTIDNDALDFAIDGENPRYPLRSFVDGQELSPAVIMPGESRTIDLYYEIPKLAKGASPAIGIDWRVRTPGGGLVKATTTFERHEIAPPPPPPPSPRQMAKTLQQSSVPRQSEQSSTPETRAPSGILEPTDGHR